MLVCKKHAQSNGLLILLLSLRLNCASHVYMQNGELYAEILFLAQSFAAKDLQPRACMHRSI